MFLNNRVVFLNVYKQVVKEQSSRAVHTLQLNCAHSRAHRGHNGCTHLLYSENSCKKGLVGCAKNNRNVTEITSCS